MMADIEAKLDLLTPFPSGDLVMFRRFELVAINRTIAQGAMTDRALR